MTEHGIVRISTALGVACVFVGIGLGLEAWLLHDPTRAMPALTRAGFVLLIAAEMHAWMLKRAWQKKSARWGRS